METKKTHMIKVSWETLLKLRKIKANDPKYKTYDDVIRERLE